jgi:hypothetical protein
VVNVPRHSIDENKFTMRVVTNKRPDRKMQYKVTLPKSLGDRALAIDDLVAGEFSLSQSKFGDEELDLYFSMYLFRNPSEEVQRTLIEANWKELTCPYCGKRAEPLIFPKGTDPISHKMSHDCGALYYADRSDRRSKREWEDIQKGTQAWTVVHNYHIQIGLVASELDPDFDIDSEDDRLVHVIFIERPAHHGKQSDDNVSNLFSR